MPPGREELIQRIYDLERDNNRLLRGMRRRSTFGAIFSLLTWAAAIGIPIWLYLQYLSPALNQALGTLNQVQGQVKAAQELGAKVTVPISDISGILEGLKARLPEGILPSAPKQ